MLDPLKTLKQYIKNIILKIRYMNSRKLNIRTENWREEPFSISRSYEEDNFDVVVVELEQDGFKGCGEGSPTEHYQESVQQTEALIEDLSLIHI